MLTINEIKNEATRFRELIEHCDKSKTSLVLDCFPVLSCKLTSMLLSYHFFELWPEIQIQGVSAFTGKGNQITHYWIELEGIVVDITGDQYNLIDDSELNEKIIKKRPFDKLHVSRIKDSYLYNLFKIREKDTFLCGFPTIGKDFLYQMELGYKQLINQERFTYKINQSSPHHPRIPSYHCNTS